MTTPNRVALHQWTARSSRSNRGTRAGGADDRVARADRLVGKAVRIPAPSGARVAAILPVPGHALPDPLDGLEPLQRLVAVHRRDVHPHGTTVRARQIAAVELVAGDNVGADDPVEP